MVEVSVCMITYNHEKYIDRAIQGVLEQDCEYKIELVISNDASTDATHYRILEAIRGNSSKIKIRYINNSENIGMMANFIQAIKECKGRYIALCEGDDYWTDPIKLQKQVDFLEANLDYAICFHPIKVYNQNEDSFMYDEITRHVPDITSCVDLAAGNFIHTPSVLFKNIVQIPKWFVNCSLGDWTLYMLLTASGQKIKKLQDEMSVYRVHNDSIWSSKSSAYRSQKTKETFNIVYQNLNFRDGRVTSVLKSLLGIRSYKSKVRAFLKKFISISIIFKSTRK